MKHVGLVVLIMLIPLAGYGIMHSLVYMLPVSGNNVLVQLLFTSLIVSLGLSVPYWMLKLGMHEAHLHNPQEEEIYLMDMPKDQNI